MKLYKQYLEELHNGKSLIETEEGFASYWIRDSELGKECYIEDIYVKPEHRKNKGTHKLAEKVAEIARENNCKVLTGTVVPSANNSTISLKMMLSNGFNLLASSDNIIWFRKDL